MQTSNTSIARPYFHVATAAVFVRLLKAGVNIVRVQNGQIVAAACPSDQRNQQAPHEKPLVVAELHSSLGAQ